MNLLKHFCYHIPAAVVFHKRVTGAKRYLASVRNRWRFMLEFYQRARSCCARRRWPSTSCR